MDFVAKVTKPGSPDFVPDTIMPDKVFNVYDKTVPGMSNYRPYSH